MDCSFTKDQMLLRKAVKEFFEKECPADKVRELNGEPQGYDAKLWQKMVKLGYTGLAIPESYGGTEGNFWDLLIFAEEMGRNIVPSPFFETAVCCALPILKFGTDEQKETWLPKIAEKGAIWTLARTDAAGNGVTATADGDDLILNGAKVFVPYARVADMLLVTARTEATGDISLLAVEAGQEGIKMDLIPTTIHDGRCEIAFDKVRVPKDKVLGQVGQGVAVLDYIDEYAAVLKAAEMSGGAEAALTIATNYARERHQFDKPIGSFQGIQFTLAELLIEVEGLRNLVYQAGCLMNEGTPSKKLNAMVKAKANQVYYAVCYHGMVIHGAIGWTDEMDLGLYHLRTRALQFDGGTTDAQLEKVALALEEETPDFLTLYAS